MDFELKPLSSETTARALERAERYRLLNEPEQAESICRDILRVDETQQEAIKTLLLSLTDQFKSRLGGRVKRARQLIPRLETAYERLYYSGFICERVGRARLRKGGPRCGSEAYEAFREAMESYEQAEECRPAGNDDALLRWNSCARTIMDRSLKPRPESGFVPFLE